MTATRPDSGPADETTLADRRSIAATTSTTHTDSSSRSATEGTTPSSSTPLLVQSSTVPTLSTSPVLAATATEVSSSMTTVVSASRSSISSGSISWGPAITASPLPNAASPSDPDTASSSTSANQSAYTATASPSGFSKGAEDITICTTIIGGVIVLALLLYAIYRRRRGATVSEIMRFRRHCPSTIILSPTPRNARLTALPIYRESRYSVRSSKHGSVISFPKSLKRSAAVPSGVEERFHNQNPYVKNLWKTAHPPSAPRTPLRECHSFLEEPTPEKPAAEVVEKARPMTSRRSTTSRMTKQSSGDTTKSGMMMTVAEQGVSDSRPATPPDSPASQQHLQERWSWTNSQAPTTPRMYAPSLRSSISSLPRFRTIKSWVRGQTDRIVEEDRPPTARSSKMPMLKNKGSAPKLAPLVTRKLSKSKPGTGSHGRIGSLSSIFTTHPGSKVLGPASPRLEEQRPVTAPAPALEMRQLSR